MSNTAQHGLTPGQVAAILRRGHYVITVCGKDGAVYDLLYVLTGSLEERYAQLMDHDNRTPARIVRLNEQEERRYREAAHAAETNRQPS
jgi:hypothetical protein